MRLGKPIIIVREHDPNHGAVTDGALRDELGALSSAEERGVYARLFLGYVTCYLLVTTYYLLLTTHY